MRIGAAVVLVPVVLSQLPLLKLRDSNVLLSFHERPAKLLRLWLLLLMVEWLLLLLLLLLLSLTPLLLLLLLLLDLLLLLPLLLMLLLLLLGVVLPMEVLLVQLRPSWSEVPLLQRPLR